MNKHLIITTNNELVRVAAQRIVYLSSDGNYSTLVLCDGQSKLITYQLGQIERMIADQLGEVGAEFIRIGKCLIINRNTIFSIHLPKQQLVLMDDRMAQFTLSASKEALRGLKELLEKECTR